MTILWCPQMRVRMEIVDMLSWNQSTPDPYLETLVSWINLINNMLLAYFYIYNSLLKTMCWKK